MATMRSTVVTWCAGAVLACGATGCVTTGDLDFLGMGTRPLASEVVQLREPLVLEVERPAGEQFDAPAPGAQPRPQYPVFRLARSNPSVVWQSPWRRPLGFGLHPGDDGGRWSVLGAGRGPLGIAPSRPRQRLTFGFSPDELPVPLIPVPDATPPPTAKSDGK